MKIVIPGDPIAKQRHRHVKRGSLVVTYDPQKDIMEEIKKLIIYEMDQIIHGENKIIAIEASNIAFADTFELEMWFYMPIPNSDSTRKRNEKLWGFQFHNVKPDYDNLAKIYGDCMNGIVWNDDAQVVHAICHKEYSLNPRVEITVRAKKKPSFPPPIKDILCMFSPDQLLELAEDFQKISNVGEIISLNLADDEVACQLSILCCFLSKISHKHLPSLKKISSKIKNDLSIEMNELIEKKQKLRFGHGKFPS